MALMDVGHYLGKSIQEVLELPVDEIRAWLAHRSLNIGK